MGAEVLIPIIGMLSLFGMISFVVWVGARTRSRIEEGRAALQTRMLEKFGSASEFVEFAKTPEGRRLIHGVSVDRPVMQMRIISAVRNGVILTLLGIAFIILGLTGPMDEGGQIAGVILLAIGIGFLISAVLSRKLSKQWADEEAESHRALYSQA